jgi:hypothetical protein
MYLDSPHRCWSKSLPNRPTLEDEFRARNLTARLSFVNFVWLVEHNQIANLA